MEDLVRLAAKPIAFIGAAILLCGLVYLGITIKDGASGGGQLATAIATVMAGAIITGFAALYGA